ncbi:MAG: glycosyltransferase family 4 protein [Phycisphaerae bacterium]|nr:glycosyltransferase family 4 protein [Phycisphaerae bacterium]
MFLTNDPRSVAPHSAAMQHPEHPTTPGGNSSPPDGGPFPRAGVDRVPPRGVHRRVTVIAVHYVRVDGQTYDGGAEKYTRQVIGALLDAGVVVHVGYSGTSIYDDLLLRAHPTQLTVERTGWLNDALSGDARLNLRTIRARRRWLRATHADTLFAVQQAGGGAFGASLVAAKSLGLRTVSSIRQLPPPLPPPARERWLSLIPTPQLWRRRLIWRRRLPAWCCDALIFNSRRVAEAHQQAFGLPRHRFRVIHNGEPARDRTGPQSPSHACNIASVGRVTEAKGADTLLDAFAAVAEEHPDARLTYYGDGPLIADLRSHARRLGLVDRITFPGFRESQDDIYPNIDICVQASRRESMSNSVIEAMARGIPCVVTDVGGLPETVTDGETGFVVPVDEPRACAAAISRLLSDRDTFARFSHAASERARTFFDVHRVMRETIETILGTAPEALV